MRCGRLERSRSRLRQAQQVWFLTEVLGPHGLARRCGDARRILGEWEAIEDLHAQDSALKGVIRVIAPVALGQSVFIEAASQFMKDHPGVTVDWRLRDDTIRFAEEGCDCWLKVGPVPDDTLVVRELARVERLVVGTPKYLAAHDRKALEAMPWLTLGPFEGNRIELFDQTEKAKVFSVAPKMASDNIFAICEAVKRGIGVAIMPHWFISAELEAGTLVDVAPHLCAASLPVNLAISSGTRRPARVERFCDTIESWCRSRLGGHV